jgi:hypothetical protein
MSKQKWDWVTDEMFDEKLRNLVAEESDLLTSIPNIYSEVSEYFNNEVLVDLANENHRCIECGKELDEEGDCEECEP